MLSWKSSFWIPSAMKPMPCDPGYYENNILKQFSLIPLDFPPPIPFIWIRLLWKTSFFDPSIVGKIIFINRILLLSLPKSFKFIFSPIYLSSWPCCLWNLPFNRCNGLEWEVILKIRPGLEWEISNKTESKLNIYGIGIKNFRIRIHTYNRRIVIVRAKIQNL